MSLQKPRVKTTSRLVAEAIHDLLPDDGLPYALAVKRVACQITDIRWRNDGFSGRMPQSQREERDTRIEGELLDDGMFKAGCEFYRQTYNAPFALVTQHFFDHIYEDDETLRACLAAGVLTRSDVLSSLPHKRCYVRDAEGEIVGIVDGRAVGAVFFEPGSDSPLLLVTAQRIYDGAAKGTVRSLSKVAMLTGNDMSHKQAQKRAAIAFRNIEPESPQFPS
jgi:hypothetical protein